MDNAQKKVKSPGKPVIVQRASSTRTRGKDGSERKIQDVVRLHAEKAKIALSGENGAPY